MAPWQRITLVAAGAGAGIAATFNTPIGGVMFAIELMMPELSARTFLPVALATGTATFIGRIFFGIHPAFAIPNALLASQAPASLEALIFTRCSERSSDSQPPALSAASASPRIFLS